MAWETGIIVTHEGGDQNCGGSKMPFSRCSELHGTMYMVIFPQPMQAKLYVRWVSTFLVGSDLQFSRKLGSVTSTPGPDYF